MTRCILIASGKGGVGKSSITAGLGRIFCSAGLKTLLIDCDAGLSSLDIMLGLSEGSAFSWHDAYLERCSIYDAIIKNDELPDLLPAPVSPLDEPADQVVKHAAELLRDDYDIILIDAPAGLGRGLLRAAAAAKQLIVVATADEISVKDAAALDREIRKRSDINESRLIINRYDVKAAKKGKLLTIDDIIDKTTVQLIGVVPEDKNIMYSTVTGKTGKKSKSFKALQRISERINGKNVELELSLLK